MWESLGLMTKWATNKQSPSAINSVSLLFQHRSIYTLILILTPLFPIYEKRKLIWKMKLTYFDITSSFLKKVLLYISFHFSLLYYFSHHYYQVVLMAQNYPTLLPSIPTEKSSRQHPVFVLSWSKSLLVSQHWCIHE